MLDVQSKLRRPVVDLPDHPDATRPEKYAGRTLRSAPLVRITHARVACARAGPVDGPQPTQLFRGQVVSTCSSSCNCGRCGSSGLVWRYLSSQMDAGWESPQRARTR